MPRALSSPRSRGVNASVRLLSSASLLALVACAGSAEPRGSTVASSEPGSTVPSPVAPTAEPAVVDAPLPTELAGAAAELPQPVIPEDATPLTARMQPRTISMPSVGSGRSARFTFDGGRRGWVARLPQYARQNPLTPIYGDGRVYVGAGFASHEVFAFDWRTGALEWRAAAPDGGPTASILEDGKLLYNTESCTLFAVDARTGRQRWSHWLGDPLMGQPAAANGRVFSGHIRDGGGYGFTALDLDDGRELWTRDVPADVLNAPVLDETSVYFTTMDGHVFRMDQRSGRVRWRRRLGATSSPWLHGGTVHVARRAHETDEAGHRVEVERSVVLDGETGETVREHEAVPAGFLPSRPDSGGVESGWAFEGSRPTIVDGRAYQTLGNEVHCRDAESGELLWRRRYTDEARTRPASSPAIAGSQIVFGTRDGVLYGLDIDTGLTTWAYQVGEPVSAQPTVAHGWVYATTTRGTLVALEVGDRELDGWHMWGGNARHNGPVVGDTAPVEEDERPTEGTLALASTARAGEVAGFPLESTRVSARVSGFVAHVTVEQTFRNPYERPVEATYLFPLPDDSAVDSMQMRAGTRVVQARIQRREVARAQYRDARERGVLASLLEQERPDLFRQSVANIRPGDSISVTLTYVQALPYEEGSYRFVYPMVAGPRYMPDAEPGGAGSTAAGTAPDLHQVVLAGDAQRPDRVEVSIEAELGASVSAIDSPTHELDVVQSGNRSRVTLRSAARPDRDLDVRFHVGGQAPVSAVLASAPEASSDGTFSLAIHPRLDVPATEIASRELVFVLDTSSSMHGRPMELGRAAVIHALRGMRPTDTFRVLGFSDTARAFSDSATAATPEHVERAVEFVNGLVALGATEMITGLRAALDAPEDPTRMRMVLLVTDGYIGNETEVFRTVHEHLGRSRVFAFGVGSAVNRYLLTRVAEHGRGDVQVVTLSESPETAAAAFHSRIASPHLTDISIDWGTLSVHDAYPRRVPDLFADRPLYVHARYAEGGNGTVTIRGRVAGRAFEQRVDVTLPSRGEASRPELQSVWARTRIRDLMTAMALGPTDALREEVTTLGLTHHLLTDWTAFIAIDEGYRVDGAPVTVQQATQLPEGMTRPEVPAAAAHGTGGSTTAGAGTTAWSSSPVERAAGAMADEPPVALPMAEPPPPPVHAPRGDIDALLGGALAGGGGGGRVDGSEVLEASPDRARRSTRGVSSAYERCRQLATRADGTVDAAMLADCLARERGEGAPKHAPKQTSLELPDEIIAPRSRALRSPDRAGRASARVHRARAASPPRRR